MTKEIHTKTGVYSIMHIRSRKRYIGSTTNNFGARWDTHRKFLRQGKHHSRYLQNAWNLYGEGEFKFRVLKRCAPEDALKWEQFFIEKYNCADGRSGYNISPTAGNTRGRKMSLEHREKCRQRMLTYRHSEESKQKIREAHLGRRLTAEHRANLSAAFKASPKFQAAMLARNRSPEMRALTSARNRARTTAEIEKVAAWHRGRERTGQALENIRAGIARRPKPSPWEQAMRTAKRLETLARNRRAVAN